MTLTSFSWLIDHLFSLLIRQLGFVNITWSTHSSLSVNVSQACITWPWPWLHHHFTSRPFIPIVTWIWSQFYASFTLLNLWLCLNLLVAIYKEPIICMGRWSLLFCLHYNNILYILRQDQMLYGYLFFSTKSYTIAFDLLLLWTLLPSNFKDENIF